MSAQSAAALEDDRADRCDLPPHLTRDGGREEVTSHQFLNRPNEAYCLSCGRRVTIGSSTGTEYGHRRFGDAERGDERCEHRPEAVDPYDRVNEKTPSEQAMLDWMED